jgi:alpha/beta superfamily hydrolase
MLKWEDKMSRSHVVSRRSSHRARRIILWILSGLTGFVIIAYFGIGAIAASQLTLPKRVFDPTNNPGVFNLQYEDFTFPAREDGLKIAAWYIPSDNNQKVIVLVHGRDDSRTKAFGGQFVSFANVIHNAGYSVLMFDLRGYGQSADSRYYFGIRERRDVLGAVDWLQTCGYQPGKIGVLGYSLGAASVIGAAAEEPAIGAIWIDSAFADIRSVITKNWVQESGLPLIFLTSTEWMTRLIYGYDITASRPIEEIAKIAPRPIYLTHCKTDQMISVSNMDQLLAVAQNTQTWVIPECVHALGYTVVPDEYNQKVISFFNTSLK